MNAATHRWHSVEYLRAIAALAVAAFHFEPHLNVILGRGAHVSGVMNWLGFGGVDLFFIISGFVVWPASWRHERSRTGDNVRFLLKRLMRVYIPYWVILAFVCGVGMASISADWLKAALLFPQPIGRQVLPVAWTLVLEVIFYAITFLLLFLPGRFRFKALCTVAGIALLGNVLPVALGSVDSTQMHRVWLWVPTVGWFGPVVAKYVLSLNLMEFALGAAIAQLARNGGLKKLAGHTRALWLITLAWLCVAIVLAIQLDGMANPDIVLQKFAISMVGAALLFLAAICTELSLGSQRLAGHLDTLLAWLGSGSYMIYLLHNVVLEFAVAYGLRAWCVAHGVYGAIIFGGSFVASIVVAAWLGNRIELPIYHKLVAAVIVRRPTRRASDAVLPQ